MKKYARVFLRGDTVRWFDFPLVENGTLLGFIGQARHEGGALMDYGFIPWDCFGPVMLIQTTELSALPVWANQPAGQA